MGVTTEVEDYVPYPIAGYASSLILISIGFGINRYLTGDAGEYTTLAVFLMMPGMVLLLASAFSMETETQDTVASVLLFLIVPVILLMNYYKGTVVETVGSSLLNGILLGAILLIIFWTLRRVEERMVSDDSPEERVLENNQGS